MKRVFLTVLAGLLLLIPAAHAGAAPPANIVNVVFPGRSSSGNLDFWKIPWSPGDKLNGAIEVQVGYRVRGLAIQPTTGATSEDPNSRRVIPKSKITFSRADAELTTGLRGPAPAPEELEPGTYLFNFVVDGIPGEDTYLAQLEAAGEYLDTTSNTWVPFAQPLAPLKLKAFAEAPVRIVSGSQLSAQWTNLTAPFILLKPLERFLDRTEDGFWYRTNPAPTVTITMPGPPRVQTSQKFTINASIVPVLDENGNETPRVHIAMGGKDQKGQTPTNANTATYDALGNETVTIQVFREFTPQRDGTVRTPRINPGTYRTTLHIETEWGTVHDLPVELRVRDSSLWPVLALVTGIFISLLATYWQRRQPLYQARVKGRHCRRFYAEQGLRIPLIEQVMARLDAVEHVGDADEATRAASLLEELVRNLPGAMTLDAAIAEIQSAPSVGHEQLWALVVDADSVATIFSRLQQFCKDSPDPAVQAMAAHLASAQWKPPGKLDNVPGAGFTAAVREGVRGWLAELKRLMARMTEPGFWDVATMLVLFILVNGSLIALQMVQSYGPNATFGSGTDYMNLLFWGFAGDTTRAKLTDLAARVLPGGAPGQPKTAGGGQSPGGQGT